jgi:hypothetical protein
LRICSKPCYYEHACFRNIHTTWRTFSKQTSIPSYTHYMVFYSQRYDVLSS